ncbi:hypothetical protein EON77_11235, partial [bacterium]
PNIGRRIVDKGILAQRVREAARKAADTIRRGSAMDVFANAGKLADCVSKKMEECELFLVEGDSAGGSAKSARDRLTQAILPLRGKILNVERARVDKALDNNEVQSLIATIGVGVDLTLGRGNGDGTYKDAEEMEPLEFLTGAEDGPDANHVFGKGTNKGIHAKRRDKDPKEREVQFDLSKLRYGKIIIMTDADVDGEHIRTLLLTFFYRYMKPLVAAGRIYLAQPPLFVVKAGKDERHYAMTEQERDEIIKSLKKKSVQVTRFKGLGEMNAEDLEETTMAPGRRRLVQVELDPQFEAEIEMMFSRLMGDNVAPRREFIERHAKTAMDVDWHY